MSLESAIKQFCSRPFAFREHAENSRYIDNSDCARCSRGSQQCEENQPNIETLYFDVVRLDCGDNVSLCSCDRCEYFTPDPVGDGAGIGQCKKGIEWTQEPSGRLALFRYAYRYCRVFSKLIL